jgi:DNA-binding transcriptional ArsR family regulator
MRTTELLNALFPRTRQAILSATLLRPERSWYLRDLARQLGVVPSSLQRELAALVAAGILTRRRDGNRTYYQAERACPIYPELRTILEKTSGLTDIIAEVLRPFAAKIDWAFVYGSVAREQEQTTSDVDVLVIGGVGLAEVAPALRQAERRLERPVNAAVYSRAEFTTKWRAGQHFVRTVMAQPKVMILGDANELADLIADEPRAGAHHEQGGVAGVARVDRPRPRGRRPARPIRG